MNRIGRRGEEATVPGVSIRPFTDVREAGAIEGVQRRAWGFRDLDIVPHRLMAVVARNGGILLGAFERERLIGFVFGYPGRREGRSVHCSHMLAVEPRSAGKGIGRALKLEQRRLALEVGEIEVVWTFDPLEGRNAHFNLRRLGARGVDYWPDLYGATSSSLHAGVATDRLVVSWRLGDPRVRAIVEERGRPETEMLSSPGELPRINDVARARGRLVCDSFSLVRRARRLALVVPAGLGAWREESPGSLARWQTVLRQCFTAYLGRGYHVVDYEREFDEGLGAYVLEQAG